MVTVDHSLVNMRTKRPVVIIHSGMKVHQLVMGLYGTQMVIVLRDVKANRHCVRDDLGV